MTIEVRPATTARFDDLATMLGPKNPDSSVCWCLSHRVDSKTTRELIGRARGEYVKQLTRRAVAPGRCQGKLGLRSVSCPADRSFGYFQPIALQEALSDP